MYDKIIHLSILSTLIYEKFITIKWLKKMRHKFVNYEKVKDHFIIQRFVTYTSLGNNLSILFSFYSILFNTKPDTIFFILTWNTLFCVTFGYWILVFPKIIFNDEPKYYLADFLAHGPGLFFYSLLAIQYDIQFNMEYAIYPILLGYFYLFFIWYPWYKLTGDTIYEAMSKNWENRFLTIIRMNLMSIIGHILSIYIFN
tara:strand:+ start:424 stop:1020 length:597 start_codon:yes stop_codon:yes gene_type:complete